MSVTIWMVLAGTLGLAELLTGTFYLLALACGAAGGALFAQFELDVQTQFIGAILLGIVGVAICYYLKRHLTQTNVQSEQTQSLDIGREVSVTQWHADGQSASVNYRGALWNARLASPLAQPLPTPCQCRIVDMQGSQLIIEPI
jgi:membrane protein implicated in regulation of membrane protease activity